MLGHEAKSGGFCCQVPPNPANAGKGERLKFSILGTAYAATAIGAWLSFATIHIEPVTVASCRVKANTFRRPSILFRPHDPK